MAMESESGRLSGALGDGSTIFGTILVSGATGFVGFHVVRALLAHSGVNQVRCLTRKPTPELEELAAVSGGRVQICVGDLGTVESCRSSVAPHLADVDGVINCAAHYRWWTKSPDQFRRLNAEAAGELAALSRQAGVRQFVQVSTILAMGSPGDGWGSAARPLQPDTPLGRPASRYAASKAAGDEAVLRVAAEAAAEAAEVGAGASGAAAGRIAKAPRVAEAAAGSNAEGTNGVDSAAVAAAATAAATAAAAATEGKGSVHDAAGEGQGASSSAVGGDAGGGGGSGRPFAACVVALGCVVGADRRLVAGGEEDVMRIADLVRGKVPATLGHETTFTYIGVRDAAAAIVAALHRGKTGRRYLIGNQRMTTDEYYNLIARLSGTPPPRPVVPVWLAAGWAQAAAALATLTGVPPQAPPDLIRTVAYGTLLYDSGCSEAELGLALPYRDIAASFQEAVECVKRHDAQRVAGARP